MDGLEGQHRGGLLGLGAVLAATSAPLRTSAVKRGDWVLRRIVGTPVPPPPADVGSIPADDVLADGLTVRQRLEAHRARSFVRQLPLADRPARLRARAVRPARPLAQRLRDGQAIDASGTLRDGTTVSGPEGLRDYLRREKAEVPPDVSVKLLGYALGRSELASDRPLIERMTDGLAGGGRFADLVVQVVTSEQFRNRRSRVRTRPPSEGERERPR